MTYIRKCDVRMYVHVPLINTVTYEKIAVFKPHNKRTYLDDSSSCLML